MTVVPVFSFCIESKLTGLTNRHDFRRRRFEESHQEMSLKQQGHVISSYKFESGTMLRKLSQSHFSPERMTSRLLKW
jgi:hypothetical protein